MVYNLFIDSRIIISDMDAQVYCLFLFIYLIVVDYFEENLHTFESFYFDLIFSSF
jgi:hypothetical protein